MTNRLASAIAIAALTPLLLGASVPLHVQTADYVTRAVAPEVAARWLTWQETDPRGSARIRAYGTKTLLYTNPNMVIPRMPEFPEYAADEGSFAHDCSGTRIMTNYPDQYLMDPHSATLRAVWKKHVERYESVGHFDAIFVDDADDLAYVRGLPCNYDARDWLSASNAMQQSLGYPIIYNGLSIFSDRHVSASIGLNDTSIGGMMEQCYAPSRRQPKARLEHWIVNEMTELEMAAERKLFFCYGNDTNTADEAIDARLYVYASFLLSYDPSTSVLWEYYQGPLHFHVMPESQLVALDPEKQISTVADLLTPSGLYERNYRACFLAGSPQGPCVAVVNPSEQPLALTLQGYNRTLQLANGGVLDGGTVNVAAAQLPKELPPLSAVIAFK